MTRFAFAFATAFVLAAAVTAPATALSWFANLDGAQEVPSVMTEATGRGDLRLMGDMLSVDVMWSNLTSDITIAHIHIAPAGSNGPVAIDFEPPQIGPGLSGSFSRLYDLSMASTYTAGFLNANGGTAAGARMALLAAFDNGGAYFNLHTATFPGGEIRGQIAAVPEPATWAMLIAGFGLVGAAARRRTPATANA